MANRHRDIHKIFASIRKSTEKMALVEQKYDCFLVLDFEATCCEDKRISKPEIIEFPVLKVDARTFDIVHQFHEYVRPVLHPQLTDFCTRLTGITQEMVDRGEQFPDVMNKFESWMNENTADQKFLFVTCGDWDLKSMLPDQCKRENVDLPPYCSTFMNIKKTFANWTGIFTKGMLPMLKELNLKHVGRHHSGIDDCNNIANILRSLANKGCIFEPTFCNQLRKHHSTKVHAVKGTRQFHSLPVSPHANNDNENLKNDTIYGKFASGYEKENLDLNVYPNLKAQCFAEFTPREAPRDTHEHRPKESNYSDNARLETNYPVIVTRLRENISAHVFSNEYENLQVLLASAKYMDLMEVSDRIVIQNRLRYYFIALFHGWKIAKQDAKDFGTESVGIHIKHKGKTHSHHTSKKSSRRDQSQGSEH